MANNDDKYHKITIILLILLRIVIGFVFIFSGFVKAIDPWGTIYKFEEYISILHLMSLMPFVTFMAYAVAVFEFVFGVFVILGCYRRIAPLLLLLSMGVMLPLTFYLMVTDSLKDCGCFGDAIYMSNTATFIKNVFITAGLVFLFLYNKKLKNIYGYAVQWLVALFSFLFIITICIIGYSYQPLIDFRSFKVGTNLVEHSDSIAANTPEYKFIYKKNGVQKEFSIDSIPGDDWEFVDRIEVGGGKQASDANRLVISEDDTDITSDIIKGEGEQILLLFPKLSDVEISYTFVINEIYDLAQTHGVSVIGLTSASEKEIDDWKDLSMASYPLYIIDDSVLKQIARGNPAIVYLKDGVIQWKRALRSIPIEQFTDEATDMSLIADAMEASKILYTLISLYFGLMIILLAINRTHKVLKLKSFFDKKNENKDVTLHPDN